MGDYKIWGSENEVKIKDPKNFKFPSTGEKILLKKRPPIAKKVSTD